MLLTCFSKLRLRLLDIDVKKLADVAKLPDDELADAPDLNGKGVRCGRQELTGDVIKLFLAFVYSIHQRWIVLQRLEVGETFCDLFLKLLGTLADTPGFIVQNSKRSQ